MVLKPDSKFYKVRFDFIINFDIKKIKNKPTFNYLKIENFSRYIFSYFNYEKSIHFLTK